MRPAVRPFVAIDFETANETRRSACAIGLARFDETGQLTATATSLIRPHQDVFYFNPINTWVHGLTSNDVADAPEWNAMAQEVREFIGDAPLVAHNMGFDGSVLNHLTELYGTDPLPNRRLCTLRLARRLLAEQLDRKSLDNVYDYYFPGETFVHHEASADAEAAGRIFARMQDEHGYEELELLCPPTRARNRGIGGSGVHRSATLATAAELIDQIGATGTPLAGHRVVFTGTLQRATRATAQEVVTACGGQADKSLTRKTTMLVVGIPNPQSWREGQPGSSKMVKAAALREKGSPIMVVSEEEFFAQLAD